MNLQKQLEFVITDFCNLNCSLCSQGIPLQKEKKLISLEDLERMAKFIKPFEFQHIKISGGEPTMHPQFSQICGCLRKLFPAYNYYLATNGFMLEKFVNDVKIFDVIILSEYPGRNEKLFEKSVALNLPNLIAQKKEEYKEILDVYEEKNLNETNIYNRCPYAETMKVVQNRIYPCCNLFGQALRQNIPLDKISVVFDENWRENITKLDVDVFCKRCFVKVPSRAQSFIQKSRKKTVSWLIKKNPALANKCNRWIKNLRQKIKNG